MMAPLLVWTSVSYSDITPLRKMSDVHTGSIETKVKSVPTAKIIMADYALLRKDFAHLAKRTNSEIDGWLLNQVGEISENQTRQTTVNSKIETADAVTKAFRPPDYNRALVFEVEGGLIDGKGFGAENPGQFDHGNGLATLGEMIREFLYQKLVQKIFSISNSKHTTVACYAVIDWGFRVLHADGSSSEAGAVLRQAHHRAGGKFSLLNAENTKEVETTLRKYGVTSAGAYRTEIIERLNIQGTNEGAILDFGGFLTVANFFKPGREFYVNNWLFMPGTDGFVQPDPEHRVPLNLWGTTVSQKEDPKADNPWIWSHELGENFASGKASRADVDNHVRNLLEPFTRRFDACAAAF